MAWFVVHTQPRAEAHALRHLQNQGFCCFLPYIQTLRRHARKVERVQVPLFPRYLFVSFDSDQTRWRSINGTRGVVGLLCSSARPLPVRGGTVESLLRCSDANGLVPITALDLLRAGTTVEIAAGALTGQVGVVSHIPSADRVAVLLNFMGARTCVHLPSWQIKAA